MSVEVFQRLNQHRAWVNSNILVCAEDLNADQLQRSFEIGQGSIWKSLLHLYAAEQVWLEVLFGNETAVVRGDLPGQRPGNQQGENPIAGLAELQQLWQEQEQRWSGYVASLTAAALDEVVYRVSTSSFHGNRFGARRSDVLLHVCMHAHYTTAQVINMFRHVGVEKLPDTMLITLARQETQRP